MKIKVANSKVSSAVREVHGTATDIALDHVHVLGDTELGEHVAERIRNHGDVHAPVVRVRRAKVARSCR